MQNLQSEEIKGKLNATGNLEPGAIFFSQLNQKPIKVKILIVETVAAFTTTFTAVGFCF